MTALRNFLIFLIVVGSLGAGGWWYWQRNQTPAVTYRSVPLKRGELLVAISATGTVEPEEVVDVGAQVAGQILSFGDAPGTKGKPVDYNSTVEAGTVLAKIDDALYGADVASANASVESAKASVARAEADIMQFKAKQYQADRDWKRAQEAGKGVMSVADYDAFQAANETAKANVAVGEAALKQAKTSVIQAQASLLRANRNLGYCTISSPVKGVIIDRRVNIGQTVVSSLNAPSLFLIAKDLSRIQVWASVNEADIGNIRAGQPANFTVDAFPGRTFKGTVNKVRMSASVTQNVVTYPVEIDADNTDFALKPYMTANVQFEVDRHEDAVLVPNVALRWIPASVQQVAPESRDAYVAQARAGAPGSSGGVAGGKADPAVSSAGRAGGPTSRPAGAKPSRAPGADRTHGLVWVQAGVFVKPIRVKIGKSDTISTELLSEELKPGDTVVTGETRADVAADDAKNPFLPQFGGRSSGGSRRGG